MTIICSIPEYVACPDDCKPQSVNELLEEIRRPIGLWSIKAISKKTGKILQEQFCENNYTDNGVTAMFKALAGPSSITASPANIIAIDASLGWTTINGSIASGGTLTSINVNALTGPTIPSGTQLVINPGGGNASLTITTSANITGAGTFSIVSTSGPASLIPSGSSVRYAYSVVPTADPSSLSSPVSYTAPMATSQFTYPILPSQTGYGNRIIHITNNSAYLFSTTGNPPTTVGNYTCAWLCNANPVASNTATFVRVAFDTQLIISSSVNGQIDIYERL
jgi:hypothetical protein